MNRAKLQTYLPRVLLVLSLAILALLLDREQSLQRIDHLVYDYLLSWKGYQVSDQVVIVAVDDASIQRIGRWPWSRRQHAEILEQISAHSPKAVGFDILFSEPQTDDPGADPRFARALRASGKTILAVAPSQPSKGEAITELLPVPELAVAAAGMGHVDIEIDADGLCRNFFTHAGIGNPHWPGFALAMLLVAGEDLDSLGVQPAQHTGFAWMRSGRRYVPFDPRPNPVVTIPVHRLLDDPVVAQQVRDRYVLIGSTATGLGDVVSTPVSFDHQRMPGVELNAHILSGLLHGQIPQDIDPRWRLALSVLAVTLGAALIVSTSFPLGVLLLFSGVLLVLGLSAGLLVFAQLWFAPAAAIAPLIACFPLWAAWSLWREKRISQALALQVRHQELHHSATDLPNQQVLQYRLLELEKYNDPESLVALMVVHISWSDSISGFLGHSGSDGMLRLVASEIRGAVRSDDLVVHLNSDDFGILVEQFRHPEVAEKVASDLMETLRQPIEADDAPVYLTPRMGMSLWPLGSTQATALLRDAYVAMYRARIEHAAKPCVYSEDIAREVTAHAQLEGALQNALERGEFEVYYQPQVSTSGGRLIGVEALLRWNNPEIGLVYPGTFIPVAEHNGLIQQLGSWVLHTACRQVQEWNSRGLGPIRLAVNLSPLQFTAGDVLHDVRSALQASGLDPRALELEITESALMQNLEDATNTMRTLKRIGVNLAIDDFGTGYSSLSHLQHFPLDRIKIDGSFTREIQQNPDVREITLSIISMAKRLNLEVIAEGVETESQMVFLEQHGCDDLQGFLFGRAVPAEELRGMLEALD